MRKEYGKALRSLFQEALKSAAPEFLPVKVKSKYFVPGDRAFERKLDNGSSLWINLSPNKSGYESFNVEIGWSALGRWPELNMVPFLLRPGSSEEEEFNLEEYMTRLPFLWSDEDLWFEIEPFRFSGTEEEMMVSLQRQTESITSVEAESKVGEVLPDCIEKLVTYGMPYLEKYVAKKAG